ncbi:Hypothetical predicted protein, partial [Paramuricea clavata]
LILQCMDRREVTALLLLDLSKAFDSLDHFILLRKLSNIGISKPALFWFKSYLTGRCQSVRIASVLSDECEITRGVPQGSILGPVLFNVYINDLPGVPKESNLESYVDDSKIYLAFSIRDAELAAMKLTEDMRRITAWCCLNSLLVNPEKTKLLILGTRQMLEQVPENFQITILGENITPVAVAKDLGMILDSCLSYDEHIASVVSSCIAGLGQISRGLAPLYLREKFHVRSDVHGVNTRQKNILDIPMYRSAAGQRTFHYRVVSLWNSLPQSLKNIDTLTHFKVEYKRMLLEEFLTVSGV